MKRNTLALSQKEPYVITVGEIVMSNWTVWVGGGEINDYLLTEPEAHELAQIWKDKGYTEVVAEKIK